MKKEILSIFLIICGASIGIFYVQAKEKDSAGTTKDSYLIIPGISVGEISIGTLRDDVQSLAGEPVSSLGDGDQFSDFVVSYDDDRVVEIIITSPRYHTAEGVSILKTLKQFLAFYP